MRNPGQCCADLAHASAKPHPQKRKSHQTLHSTTRPGGVDIRVPQTVSLKNDKETQSLRSPYALLERGALNCLPLPGPCLQLRRTRKVSQCAGAQRSSSTQSRGQDKHVASHNLHPDRGPRTSGTRTSFRAPNLRWSSQHFRARLRLRTSAFVLLLNQQPSRPSTVPRPRPTTCTAVAPRTTEAAAARRQAPGP